MGRKAKGNWTDRVGELRSCLFLTANDIAEWSGVKPQAVRRMFQRHGITPLMKSARPRTWLGFDIQVRFLGHVKATQVQEKWEHYTGWQRWEGEELI